MTTKETKKRVNDLLQSESAILAKVDKLLESLMDPDARYRIVHWLAMKYGIVTIQTQQPTNPQGLEFLKELLTGKPLPGPKNPFDGKVQIAAYAAPGTSDEWTIGDYKKLPIK